MIVAVVRYALPVIVVMIVARMPLGFVLLAAFSVLVLALRAASPIRFGAGVAAASIFAMCAAASSIGAWLNGSGLLNSYAIYPLPFALIAFSIYSGPERLREMTTSAVERGLFWGFAIIFAIAAAEIIFDFSIALERYPDALGNDVLAGNRLLAASVFPGYNGIAMAGVLALALTFGRVPTARLHGKVALVLYALAVVTLSGFTASRTFILGLALILTFLIIEGWKGGANRFGKGILLATVVSATAIGAYTLSVTTYFDSDQAAVAAQIRVADLGAPSYLADRLALSDNSAQTRSLAIQNAFGTVTASPMTWLFGFGSYDNFSAASQARCARCLVDPHFLPSELAFAYGLPMMAIILAVMGWAGLVAVFSKSLSPKSAWLLLGFALLPVVALAPGNFVRYHYIWLYALAAWPLLSEATSNWKPKRRRQIVVAAEYKPSPVVDPDK